MEKTPEIDDSVQFCETHATSLVKDAPLLHYTRDLIMSTQARARFVEPDIRPLF